MKLVMLDPQRPDQAFPDPDSALTEPNGLLAIGGCLSPQRLLKAYRQGIFPWFSPGEPVLWWSPDPRLVLFPGREIISRSLRKRLRKAEYSVTYDRCFSEVMKACAEPRVQSPGTWITEDMLAAYQLLHQQGAAHSVEVWYQGDLVGGLYGVAVGQVFFGESMFHRRSDASKVALMTLAKDLQRWGYRLIDCQVYSDHLASLGAEEISRTEFNKLLQRYCPATVSKLAWSEA
jgi:leucyl/phenylalanyl-tRNA--protein transferase